MDPTSYRPICLLPILGKSLERMLLLRLQYHYSKNNILSENQYGFRQNISTEHALSNLIENINTNRANNLYTCIISIDIKGAFDSLWWPSIITRLKKDNCPEDILSMICSYLDTREIEYKMADTKINHHLQKGCPQGSCLGPFLWTIISNTILKEDWGNHCQLQAFADDFIIIIKSQNRRQLEDQASKALQKFKEWTANEKLTLSHNKTQAIVFGKKGQIKKRKPTIKFQNWKVEIKKYPQIPRNNNRL
ncbi:uncharacterized protein CEXT_770371 [Caerostris extrusa]|uniref:Reverse transcriptase domain-containing protein n=1 Tax=Caerostris extrusa TaxID=172846 RepID=A0AAV4R778_CAEEX|nr:uncharacterized protein CEXT_770371 [Caerostris extrusa]